MEAIFILLHGGQAMDIARYIDHAVLKPEMKQNEAIKAILEGVYFLSGLSA